MGGSMSGETWERPVENNPEETDIQFDSFEKYGEANKYDTERRGLEEELVKVIEEVTDLVALKEVVDLAKSKVPKNEIVKGEPLPNNAIE